MKRLVFPAMVGWLFALLVAIPAGAVTVSFDFNSGMGPNFIFNQVNTSSVSLDQTGGNLRIHSDGMSGSGVRGGEVYSNFTVHGDFDITVNFDIKQALADQQQVELHPYGMSTFYVIRDNTSGGDNYHVWDGGSVRGRTATIDTTGILRVRRVGTTAYGYFLNSSSGSYQLIYSGGVTSDDIHVGLMVQNNGSQTSSFNVAYDNLTINADGINGLVPLPPGIILSGTGLLLLAVPRLRRRR